jgi:hypothetical protein
VFGLVTFGRYQLKIPGPIIRVPNVGCGLQAKDPQEPFWRRIKLAGKFNAVKKHFLG